MEELSALEKDAIGEVGNISLGASATALSAILDRSVSITTPKLELLTGSDIEQKCMGTCLLVEVSYSAGLVGTNIMMIKEADAIKIASLMMGEPARNLEDPLNEIEMSAVQEAMNQMMGSMSTSMAELFQRSIDISPPTVKLVNLDKRDERIERLKKDELYVHVEFDMHVEDLIDSAMIQVIPLSFAKEMAGYLLAGETETASVPEISSEPGPEAVSGHSETALKAQLYDLSPAGKGLLSEMEKDTIAEVGNISLGASATALATLLGKKVDITTPQLEVIKAAVIQEKYPVPCLMVEVDYISGLQGSNVLLIKEKDAVAIASIMMGDLFEEKEGPLNEIEMSAVQEAMNQMMGSMSTSMSELFNRTIDISPPRLELINLNDERTMISDIDPDEEIVHVAFSIRVEDVFDSVMIQVIPIEFAKNMASFLLSGYEDEAQAAGKAEKTGAIDDTSLEERLEAVSSPGPVFEPDPGTQVASAPAAMDHKAADYGIDLEKLELVRDIPMDIIVVLGSARLPLGRLFALGRGGIIDLDCSVDDPVELLANDRLLARGEVVMINDQLGVRITEIQFEEVIHSYDL